MKLTRTVGGRAGVAAGLVLAGALAAAPAVVPPMLDAQRPVEAPATPAVQAAVNLGEAFSTVADQVTPAVVAIEIQRVRPTSRGAQALAAGSGSGFIVTPDGYILTNNHVVEGGDRLLVTLHDRRVFPARVVGRDPSTDVALIKIEGRDLPTARLGDDRGARVGQWVLAIGNPLGLDFTVTSGIVSAKGRSVRGLMPSQYAVTDFLQTDAAINPGNSGGPLVNIRGEVIGINSAIASPTGAYAGYGFAIPITLAKSVMRDLMEFGEVRRAIMGLSLADVGAADAERLGLSQISGVLVAGFSDGASPARRAGLREGDVIVAAEGQPVDRVGTLQRIVRDRHPGDVLRVEYVRGGRRHTASMTLASAPREMVRTAGLR